MYSLCVFLIAFGSVYSAPSVRIMVEQTPAQLLTLPSNATSIRADISDSFSCEGREYGYYADVDNDCQLFHVCLPVTYSTGRQQTFRWSFICPDETIFNQEIFTCTRSDESIDCAESPRYYNLNVGFGDVQQENESHTADEANDVDDKEEEERVKEQHHQQQQQHHVHSSPALGEAQVLEPEKKPEINRRISKF